MTMRGIWGIAVLLSLLSVLLFSQSSAAEKLSLDLPSGDQLGPFTPSNGDIVTGVNEGLSLGWSRDSVEGTDFDYYETHLAVRGTFFASRLVTSFREKSASFPIHSIPHVGSYLWKIRLCKKIEGEAQCGKFSQLQSFTLRRSEAEMEKQRAKRNVEQSSVTGTPRNIVVPVPILILNLTTTTAAGVTAEPTPAPTPAPTNAPTPSPNPTPAPTPAPGACEEDEIIININFANLFQGFTR
eukprot:TRINITY_DN509_c0_g1_i3.p1 TRINITY_DN509_c0_g1~~TRINITY_DN509_c0_g1_i3.p1  ORF type:complete len:240 (-),score=58.45 TRINITY_DN509_c0_g1_i3:181-900(-)